MGAAALKKVSEAQKASTVKSPNQGADVLDMTKQKPQTNLNIEPQDTLEGDRDFEAFMYQYGMHDDFA